MYLLAQSSGYGGISIGVAIVLMVGYVVPAMVPWWRKHHNLGAITALNLLLGWTVIGWIAAFVWALTNPPKDTT